ncbi:unnamed protein product [Ranitomeya imitator]|uniref:Ig-like domain-containing protein n=1 Tax=Ranitomeya imitator TaxID=111125 RepID=A0ABN9KUZ2_9NEOB|nr:unnamed protein product [Ranitomeya imitator]
MLLIQLIFIFIIYPKYGTTDVIQMPPILIAHQGLTAAMSCEYTDSTFYSQQWFKQIPGKGLDSLTILRTDNKIVTEDRYVFTLKKDKKSSTMLIMNLEIEDSAVYWCGQEAQLQKAADNCAKSLTLLSLTVYGISKQYSLSTVPWHSLTYLPTLKDRNEGHLL